MSENIDNEILHEALLDYKEKLRQQAVKEDWQNDETSRKFNRTTELCYEYDRRRYN